MLFSQGFISYNLGISLAEIVCKNDRTSSILFRPRPTVTLVITVIVCLYHACIFSAIHGHSVIKILKFFYPLTFHPPK